MQSWNVNVQRQLARELAVTVGYLGLPRQRTFGSRAISISRSTAFGRSPPCRPPARSFLARPLGNITQVESSGFSSYHAAWVSVTKRLSRGLQFDTSYTWSKSLDTNSLNSSGFRRPGRLRHSQPVRLVGFRCPPSVRPQRDLRSAVHRARPDARLAACHGRSVAERQSREHRDQQQQPQRRAEHRASRRHRPDPDHRFGGPVVRSVGVRGRQSLRQPGPQRRHRTGLQQHGSVAHQERAARRGARRCSSGSTCSICSTIPTSARRATSSAARRSARSRGRACPRAKRARLARFSWPCDCRSEMEVRMRARVVVLALAVTLCAPALHTSASAQVVSPRTVLVIHSGAESFPSNPILDAGIRESLASRSDVPIDYFAEYLESDLFPGEQASLAFKDYIRRKYQGRRIDLVIAMTNAGAAVRPGPPRRAVSGCADRFFRARRPGRHPPRRRRRHHRNNDDRHCIRRDAEACAWRCTRRHNACSSWPGGQDDTARVRPRRIPRVFAAGDVSRISTRRPCRACCPRSRPFPREA